MWTNESSIQLMWNFQRQSQEKSKLSAESQQIMVVTATTVNLIYPKKLTFHPYPNWFNPGIHKSSAVDKQRKEEIEGGELSGKTKFV